MTTRIERRLSVVKHNDIVQKARYQLDVVQQKTILYLISKIDSVNDEHFAPITVDTKDLCEIMGIEYCGKNLETLKEALKKLSDKSLWVDTGDQIRLMRWLQRVDIKKGERKVKIQFDELMSPYLLKIKNRFFQYELINVLAMKCKYSIRLYEMLKSREAMGSWTVELDEFKKIVGADEQKAYENYKLFRQRVLDPAIIEICNYSDLTVSYRTKREDRKIKWIIFEMVDISDEDWTEGRRREINREIAFKNISVPEVVPPKKIPTTEDIVVIRKNKLKRREQERHLERGFANFSKVL